MFLSFASVMFFVLPCLQYTWIMVCCYALNSFQNSLPDCSFRVDYLSKKKPTKVGDFFDKQCSADKIRTCDLPVTRIQRFLYGVDYIIILHDVRGMWGASTYCCRATPIWDSLWTFKGLLLSLAADCPQHDLFGFPAIHLICNTDYSVRLLFLKCDFHVYSRMLYRWATAERCLLYWIVLTYLHNWKQVPAIVQKNTLFSTLVGNSCKKVLSHKKLYLAC